MSILSVMIYSNRTSHCAEKFISSSLCASSHPPLRLCVHVMSAEFAPLLNISQNKWTLEEGGGGSGRIHAVPLPLRERPHLGEIVLRFPRSWSSGPSLGTEVPETLIQLCFIHFIRKGSFKIQLRDCAGSIGRQEMRSLLHGNSAGESSAGFNNL